MRVAIVTAFPEDPDRPRGGVEAISTTLVRGLAAHRDLELHVVTVRRSAEQPATREWQGTTVHTLPWRGASTLTSAIGSDRRQVHHCLSRLRPDLVHAHDTFGIMVRGYDAPRVLTIHGLIYRDTEVSGQRFAAVRSMIWRLIETRAWADYPHIISISPYVREQLAGRVAGEIHDIDNPIDAEYFDVADDGVDSPTVFSAAVISRRKNTLNLVEAVLRLNEQGVPARLRLAGPIVEAEYYEQVLELIARRGAESIVTLLGSIDRAAVRAELGQAAVFALVSREENSPVGIEEAMAAGVPVVTSNRCGMPYMVREGESGWLVDPENVDEIATRLGQVITSSGARRRMGQCGREVALTRFHPAVVAARTRDVYLRALARLP